MKETCQRARETLIDLPDASHDPGPFVTRHLETCRACRSFWEGWQATGAALRALDQPEPVDRGRIALAIARAYALKAGRAEKRPLSRDLVPALLLGGVILGVHAGAWILWGVAGLAGVQAVSGLLLPLAVLGAVRRDFTPTGGQAR